jgi:deazaflavin-dependent oxidoreductase (nitroreductase family)
MISTSRKLEKTLFRTLNRFVEPAVRKGVLSPQYSPVGMIVLESVGYKSGTVRSTPLVATRLGSYTFISTARGARSFWVRNLQNQPDTTFYVGGQAKKARSYVITPETRHQVHDSLPPVIASIAKFLARRGTDGWAFAILQTTD